MTWAAVLGLGVAAYALKAIGPVLVGRRPVPEDVVEVLGLIAVPVLAALILVQTFDGAGRLMLDARAPAMGVAALLVWRRAPFLVVVLGAAATAALLRAIA